MFERFTSGARQAIVLAQEEARRFHHNYIGTEHLLLGVLNSGEEVAVGALNDVGVDADLVRRATERLIGRGKRPPEGHIPFTPRAKKVLELSLREALQLGDNFIAGEHLLLGLVSEGEDVAAQILVEAAGSLERTRAAVLARRAGTGRPEPPPAIDDVSDEGLLRHVVDRATRNADRGEPPFAALVVRDGQVVGHGVGGARHDPTAHAEMLAIRAACRDLGTRRLTRATLVASCEPCPMCRGAAAEAGLDRIVYAAPRSAAAGFTSAAGAVPAVQVPVDGADEPFRRPRAAG